MGHLPDGKAVFVGGVIVGETVEVELTKQSARYAEAALVNMVYASPQRVEPPCPYFGECGGCAYQHMPYPMQLETRRGQIAQVLKRIGRMEDIVVHPVTPSPLPYGYRNRITVHCRGGKIGFHRRGGRGLIDIDRCLLASESVNQRLTTLRGVRDVEDGARTLRQHEDLPGFHQTNDAVAALLLDRVESLCAGSRGVLIDAYCGGGFFAKRLAAQFDRVIGIEWSARSLAAAKEGALLHEEYLEGDVAEVLPALLGELDESARSSATVILDPPSQGADEHVLGALDKMPVARIIYVSCNPGTLARDLNRLRHGYRFDAVFPFDMFPQTAEVEVVATGSRR